MPDGMVDGASQKSEGGGLHPTENQPALQAIHVIAAAIPTPTWSRVSPATDSDFKCPCSYGGMLRHIRGMTGQEARKKCPQLHIVQVSTAHSISTVIQHITIVLCYPGRDGSEI